MLSQPMGGFTPVAPSEADARPCSSSDYGGHRPENVSEPPATDCSSGHCGVQRDRDSRSPVAACYPKSSVSDIDNTIPLLLPGTSQPEPMHQAPLGHISEPIPSVYLPPPSNSSAAYVPAPLPQLPDLQTLKTATQLPAPSLSESDLAPIRRLAQERYSNDRGAQLGFEKIMELVKIHQTSDAFYMGHAPGLSGYGLNRIPLGFVYNQRGNTADLLIVNWQGNVPREFTKDAAATAALGQPTYVVRGLPAGGLTTQGPNLDFFNHLPGSQIDWYNRGGVLSENHFLRRGLGASQMLVVAPENYFHVSGGNTNATALSPSTIYNVATSVGVSVHEMYHVYEANEQHRTGQRADFDADAGMRGFNKLLASQQLQRLYYAYFDTISTIATEMVNLSPKSDATITTWLGYLKAILSKMKSESPEFWMVFKDNEFAEGFAKYVEAQAMIDTHLRTPPEQVQHEVQDDLNGMFYRTGAMGGLYVHSHYDGFGFEGLSRDYDKAIWERILDQHAADIHEPTALELDRYLGTLPGKKITYEVNLMVKYLKNAGRLAYKFRQQPVI